MKNRLQILSYLVFLPLVVASCTSTEEPGGGGKECTLIGCQSGLAIAFQASNWPAGQWKVVASMAGEERSCTVSLPLPGSGQPQCQGKLLLGTSGSALPPASHSLTGVQLPDTPTQVTVEVLRDGVSQAKKAYQLIYKTTQPNGPGCDPICTQAADTLAW